MGRFSPTVAADYGPGLNVGNLLSGYREGQDRARGNDQQKIAEALQALQLQRAGIHQGQAPQTPAPITFSAKPGAFDPTSGTFLPSTVSGPAQGMSPVQQRPGTQQLGNSGYYQDETQADAYTAKEQQSALMQQLLGYQGKAAIEAEQFKGQETFKHDLTAPDRAAQESARAQAAAQAAAALRETMRHNQVEEGQGHYTFGTAGVDPTTGQPMVFRGDTRNGSFQSTGVVKPVSAGGMAGGALAPVGDMEARLAEIEGAANDVAAGKLHIDRMMQAREGLGYGIANASAGGKGVPVTSSLAAGAMDLLGMGHGKDYERYAALMNSTRAFGDDAAKVFKGRQNEDAVKREIALSELTPDDYQNPQVVQQKLSRLHHVLELARATMPQTGNAGPSQRPSTALPRTGNGKSTGHTIVVNGKTFTVPD